MSVYKVCINFFSCVLNWPQHSLLHIVHVFARCEGAKRKVVSYLFFFALAKYFSISAGMCIVRVCFFKAFCRKLRPKWNIKWKIICPMKSTSFLCQLCQHCIHTAFIRINAGEKERLLSLLLSFEHTHTNTFTHKVFTRIWNRYPANDFALWEVKTHTKLNEAIIKWLPHENSTFWCTVNSVGFFPLHSCFLCAENNPLFAFYCGDWPFVKQFVCLLKYVNRQTPTKP